jgi:hypothetical protein
MVKVTADFYWVPDGVGLSALGQYQSNNPGYGTAQGPGEVPAAQSLRLIQGESVPGGDSPTQANFNTALSSAATDIETQMGTAGAFGGNPGTPLALIQAWSTGGP